MGHFGAIDVLHCVVVDGRFVQQLNDNGFEENSRRGP